MDAFQLLSSPICGKAGLRAALDSGKIRSIDLTEAVLATVAATQDSGGKIFMRVFSCAAREQARQADERISAGETGPLLGIPVSLKDLFDVAGEQTTAGAKALADVAPATRDAEVVSRLKAAGAVLVGHTGMTEFAFSGLGINPHFGTPLNPWDKASARIPGGSSSGAAVALAEGMCALSIGTDTGGSVRIPAALCGHVGFKPSQQSISLEGVFPLSPSLDSVGPLARSVADARLGFEVLSGRPSSAEPLAHKPRLVAPTNIVREDMDAAVRDAFTEALATLSGAGWTIDEIELPPLEITREMAQIGSFPGLEAWRAHRNRIAERGSEYDPRVRTRIEAGGRFGPNAEEQLVTMRRRYIAAMTEALVGYDGLVMPTVPLVAPPLTVFESDDDYGRINLLMLRNPTLINLLDGCAISLPLTGRDGAPVGLSIASVNGADRHIFDLATEAEPILRATRPQ